MSRKKISTTIYVTPEQNELLRLLHNRTKVPVAVYIREGIDLVLRQYGHLLPGQLSLTPDLAPERDSEGGSDPSSASSLSSSSSSSSSSASSSASPALPSPAMPERAARATKG